MQKIINDKQYKECTAKIEALLSKVDNNTDTSNPNYIELDKLSNLVADYEEVYLPISKPSLIDTIKLRMFEMDLSQKKLADLLGVSASRVSEYLAGKRNISFEVAKKIHKKLDIDAEIILG